MSWLANKTGGEYYEMASSTEIPTAVNIIWLRLLGFQISYLSEEISSEIFCWWITMAGWIAMARWTLLARWITMAGWICNGKVDYNGRADCNGKVDYNGKVDCNGKAEHLNWDYHGKEVNTSLYYYLREKLLERAECHSSRCNNRK